MKAHILYLCIYNNIKAMKKDYHNSMPIKNKTIDKITKDGDPPYLKKETSSGVSYTDTTGYSSGRQSFPYKFKVNKPYHDKATPGKVIEGTVTRSQLERAFPHIKKNK
jgi:hypothetical protein